MTQYMLTIDTLTSSSAIWLQYVYHYLYLQFVFFFLLSSGFCMGWWLGKQYRYWSDLWFAVFPLTSVITFPIDSSAVVTKSFASGTEFRYHEAPISCTKIGEYLTIFIQWDGSILSNLFTKANIQTGGDLFHTYPQLVHFVQGLKLC